MTVETRNRHNRPVTYVSTWINFGYVGCAVLFFLFSACSTKTTVQSESPQENDIVPALSYSIVCIIHGDGNYLFHDTSGYEYNADEEALGEINKVAQQNPNAEVFIFHQRPKKHFLFFFPLHDGEFYYYRNGRLIANELYWRGNEQSRFTPETELYHRFRSISKKEAMNIFLYLGHEIPEFSNTGYDASYPERAFSVLDLANGVKGFTADSVRFDLMVLSTCFGGTPHTIETLGKYARYIIASPGTLHLSYFDLRSLEHLEFSAQDADIHVFAKGFARQAYDRLTQSVQTEVGVAVYDTDRVQEFLQSVQATIPDGISALEHCDCADLPAYRMGSMHQGVEVFYRPALFGRLKLQQNHSGWGCWKEREQQKSISRISHPVVN